VPTNPLSTFQNVQLIPFLIFDECLTTSIASLYDPISAHITETQSGERLGKGATTATLFAEKVVANAIKEHSTLWFWCGAMSRIVWFVTTFLPHTFLVSSHAIIFLAAILLLDEGRCANNDLLGFYCCKASWIESVGGEIE
jgi:hypothetical protein